MFQQYIQLIGYSILHVYVSYYDIKFERNRKNLLQHSGKVQRLSNLVHKSTEFSYAAVSNFKGTRGG